MKEKGDNKDILNIEGERHAGKMKSACAMVSRETFDTGHARVVTPRRTVTSRA